MSNPMVRHLSAMRRPVPVHKSLALFVGAVILGGIAQNAVAAGPAPANCLSQLSSGSGAEVICTFPTALGERERAELRRMTGDLVVDARCLVHIRIERRQIAAALVKPDHVFHAPPQPVVCELITRDDKLPIKATFSPRIVIKGGRAVDASPGMANLTGLNEFVVDPVLQYVNQSDSIRAQMIKMVNLYIANKQIGAQVFQGRS
jgi:hypothetical protein